MSLDVPYIMTALAKPHGKNFIYQGKTLELEEVFAYDGALPIFVKKANLLSDFLFGGALRISFPSDPDALTGERVEISPQQRSFIMIMLLYDVLEEMVVTSGDGDITL